MLLGNRASFYSALRVSEMASEPILDQVPYSRWMGTVGVAVAKCINRHTGIVFIATTSEMWILSAIALYSEMALWGNIRM